MLKQNVETPYEPDGEILLVFAKISLNFEISFLW